MNQDETTLLDTLTVSKTALGPKHPTAIKHLDELCRFYLHKGIIDKAEFYLEQELDLLKETNADYQAIKPVVQSLSCVYEKRDEKLRGEKLYLCLMRRQEKLYGATHETTRDALDKLAGYYYRTGSFCQARSAWEELVDVIEIALGQDKAQFAQAVSPVLSDLAAVLGRMELRADQVIALEKQVRILDAAGDSNVAAASALTRLADVLTCMHDIDQVESLKERAELCYRRALDILKAYDRMVGANAAEKMTITNLETRLNGLQKSVSISV